MRYIAVTVNPSVFNSAQTGFRIVLLVIIVVAAVVGVIVAFLVLFQSKSILVSNSAYNVAV